MKWQRPITTRRYLHPPKSERMHTLWSEGKLVFGEIFAPSDIEKYSDYVSSGIWFVTGAPDGQLDFHLTENVIRDDGVPIHAVKHVKGGMQITIEAFSSFERSPSCFIELRLTNTTGSLISDKLGFVLRTASEKLLVKDGPDMYRSYAPEISAWLATDSTWEREEDCYRSADNYITVTGDIDFSFDAAVGCAMAEVNIPVGESLIARFVYSKGAPVFSDYESEKERCVLLWNNELLRIKNIPTALSATADGEKMVKHLVAALLQNFNYPKNEDFLMVRQGGLSRMTWPYEAMPALEALARLGDFDEYVEPIIDTYFTTAQSEDGEIVPFGIHWAMCTANALRSLAKYAIVRGKDYFLKYRDRALSALHWIDSQRLKAADGDLLAGLFPPRRANDDDNVFQAWANTDINNLAGIRALAEAFERFSDPAAVSVRAICEDYYGVLSEIWANISARAKDSDELSIPLTPVGDDSWLKESYVFREPICLIIEHLDPGASDVEKIINYYSRRGAFGNGLYNRMPDKNNSGSIVCNLDENGKSVVWYVSVHENAWFNYFMKHGDRARAKEIIDGNANYAMTKEYYMIERYHENDPYFCPWSPNVSANGRTINMLLDYYS